MALHLSDDLFLVIFSVDKTGGKIYLYREQSCTKIFAKDCTKKQQKKKPMICSLLLVIAIISVSPAPTQVI